MKKFPVYKGLQKPLIYRGFKGKYIYWGVGCLVLSLVLGGLLGSLINIVVGVLTLVSSMFGGLFYTASKQKNGLYDKTIRRGVFFIPVKFNNHGKKKESRV